MTIVKNMKIGTKIYTGFGLVILVLVTMVGLTMNGLNKINTEFAQYQELVDDGDIVSELTEAVFNVQEDALIWLRTQEQERLDHVYALEPKIAQRMQSAKDEFVGTEQYDELSEIEEDITRFFNGVRQVDAFMAERNDLVLNVMDKIGPEIRRMVSQIAEGAYNDEDYETASHAGFTNQELLLARLYAGKFLLTNEISDKERFDKHYKSLTDSLDVLDKSTQNPARRALLANIQTELPKYQEAFLRAQTIINQRNAIIKEDIIAAGLEIVDNGNLITEGILAEQKALYEVFVISKKTVGDNIMILGLIGFVIAAGIAITIARQIILPIRAMQDSVDILAQGDLTATMPQTDGKDEIAEMCRKVQGFIEKLRDVISSIKATSSDIGTNSDEMASSSNGLASRAEQQASTLEETAASMEELTSTVKTNADNAKEANQAAIETRSIAEKGSQVANDAGEAMGKINESSKEITDIINVIDEIAFQTNLLALNAAVEAARAGDAGRGFAVVAQEVRTLAQRSAQSSKDIKALIDNSSKQVSDGVDLVNTAVGSLQQIHDAINSVADSVGQISTASSEQATSLDELNQAVMEMDSMTQQNASMAQQTRNVAGMMQGSSRNLTDMVAFFKVNENDTALSQQSFTTSDSAAVVASHPAPANESTMNGRDVDYKKVANGGAVSMANAHGPSDANDADWKEF